MKEVAKCQIYALGRAGRALALSLADIDEQPDVLFLSVPDSAISDVAQKLSQVSVLPRIVAHLSGAYSYELLSVLKNKAAIAQFHPLAPLTGDKPIPPGSLCAVSADQPSAQEALEKLAHQIGLIHVLVEPDKTALYHAAAVLTGNLSLALVHQSVELMSSIGIDPKLARIGLASLLRSAAENLEHNEVHAALTGPVARGDTKTIERHLEVLPENVKQVYAILTQCLSRLMASKQSSS